ncbi:MAG: hypothetical protein MO852_08220 [Candidatus Devosia euplotis]|nr:hypothetical protein [Candidatus Devosia euplotis]
MEFVARIESAAGLRVAIDNDCSMALLGEAAFGAVRGRRNVVMLIIGAIGRVILDQERPYARGIGV